MVPENALTYDWDCRFHGTRLSEGIGLIKLGFEIMDEVVFQWLPFSNFRKRHFTLFLYKSVS